MSETPGQESAPDAAFSARERWCWIERARAAARRAAAQAPPEPPKTSESSEAGADASASEPPDAAGSATR